MPRATILGTGAALGEVSVSSEALDKVHGFPRGHIERLTGVARRPLGEATDQIELAAAAARAALMDAGTTAGDLDAILHAAAVPYQTIPATAPLVQRALGLPDGAVAAYDVGATCLGFLAALQHAAAMVEAGRWQRVLTVTSDRVGANLDWREPAAAGLFGDGAGAAVVGPSVPSTGGLTIGQISLETHPSGYEAAQLRAGGTRLGPKATADDLHFAMDGPALFAVTRRRFAPFVGRFLEAAGLIMEDIDLIVPHQASPAALKLMARALRVPTDRLMDQSTGHGNLVSASLPVTLDHAQRTDRIAPGGRVLMLGTAAGLTFGAALLERDKCA